jgi:hypothetical protein
MWTSGAAASVGALACASCSGADIVACEVWVAGVLGAES